MNDAGEMARFKYVGIKERLFFYKCDEQRKLFSRTCVQHTAKVLSQFKFIFDLTENTVYLRWVNIQPCHQCLGGGIGLIMPTKAKFKMIHCPVSNNNQVDNFSSLF